MVDPCRKSKCISYPICLNKRKIKCKDLSEHIDEYINKKFGIKLRSIEPGSISFKYEQSAELWLYINSFLKNLNEVTVSISWRQSGLYSIDLILQQTTNSTYRCLNVVQSTHDILKKKVYNQENFPMLPDGETYERTM